MLCSFSPSIKYLRYTQGAFASMESMSQKGSLWLPPAFHGKILGALLLRSVPRSWAGTPTPSSLSRTLVSGALPTSLCGPSDFTGFIALYHISVISFNVIIITLM